MGDEPTKQDKQYSLPLRSKKDYKNLFFPLSECRTLSLPPPLFVSSCDSEGGRGPGETTQEEEEEEEEKEEEEEGDAVRLDKCLLDRWGGGRGSPPHW